jgi:hypothetical protein
MLLLPEMKTNGIPDVCLDILLDCLRISRPRKRCHRWKIRMDD